MSLADHQEKHLQEGDTVKDIVIGMADRLTGLGNTTNLDFLS
jgi:hypothetical protein